MAKTVLVINSGSSSIKYQLVDLETGEGIASGLVEKIGERSTATTSTNTTAKSTSSKNASTTTSRVSSVCSVSLRNTVRASKAPASWPWATAWSRAEALSPTRPSSLMRRSSRLRTSRCSLPCTTALRPRAPRSCANCCRMYRRSSCSIPPSSSSCRRPPAPTRSTVKSPRSIRSAVTRPRHLALVRLLEGPRGHWQAR